MDKGYIYLIISPTKRKYVGSTKNIRKRTNSYKRCDCKSQIKLYRSLQKYGWNNHIFKVIYHCPINERYKYERFFGLLYNVLSKENLNLALPSYNDLPAVYSEELKLKRSKRKISLEHKAKLHAGLKNRKLSKEGREVFSKRCKAQIGDLNPNAKIVLNLETGIFYTCVKEAAMAANTNYSSFKGKLNEKIKHKNNTSYKIV